MTHLAPIAHDLRQLLADYCDSNAPTLYPFVTHKWDGEDGFESITVSLYERGDKTDESFAYVQAFAPTTAAKILEAVILDRHDRCRVRSVSAAEERTADADFRRLPPGQDCDASDGEPE